MIQSKNLGMKSGKKNYRIDKYFDLARKVNHKGELRTLKSKKHGYGH